MQKLTLFLLNKFVSNALSRKAKEQIKQGADLVKILLIKNAILRQGTRVFLGEKTGN